MDKLYPGSGVTQGRQAKLTHYTRFRGLFQKRDGFTIFQHTTESTKWQERQSKRLVTQGLVSLFHIQKGVTNASPQSTAGAEKHLPCADHTKAIPAIPRIQQCTSECFYPGCFLNTGGCFCSKTRRCPATL